MQNVGVIGCGRIGLPIILAIQSGQAGDWSLQAVLTRTEKSLEGVNTLTDADAFFQNKFDLIIDAAGPTGLGDYGVRALSMANLWTVNAAALVDPELYNNLEQTGRKEGNRLRVLSGAIAGLDGVAAVSLDAYAELQIIVDLAPGDERKTLFKGAVAEAARLFPDCVNVAMAAALSSFNPGKVQVEVMQPGPGDERALQLNSKSKYGQVKVKTVPTVIPDKHIHMVAACIIAALRRDNDVIWTG